MGINDFFEDSILVTYQEAAQIQQMPFSKEIESEIVRIKGFIGGDRVWIKKRSIEFYVQVKKLKHEKCVLICSLIIEIKMKIFFVFHERDKQHLVLIVFTV